MPGKSARRTGGGQHARTGYDAAVKKRRNAEEAQQAARRSANSAKQAKQSAPGSGRSGDGPALVGRAGEADVQREWSDPIWQVRGPDDSPTPEDTFAIRVERVMQTCREKWPENIRDPPPDKSACEKQLLESKGHAGKAISTLLPPSVGKSGVTIEGLKDNDSPVLPEFMVQKINDLGTQLEAQQKESEEIHRKFQMIDKSENGSVDAMEFATLVGQLGFDLSDEEIAQAFIDIDKNGDGLTRGSSRNG